jgi:SAM-dependent methyltransferase
MQKIIREQNFQTVSCTSFAAIQELYDAEKFLINYNYSLVKRISGYLNKEVKLLEFGAGVGNLASLWFKHNKVRPECVEIDNSFREILKARGFVTYPNIDSTLKKYEAVYTSNVLEHIHDDDGSIKDLYNCLDDDGFLIVYVPAFMLLFSEFDRNAGHYRRYGRWELTAKIENAGFHILTAQYVDSLGFLAALLVKFLGYKNKYKLGSSKSLQFYDKYIWPISLALDKLGLKFFFGKNLFVVAKKMHVGCI